MSTLLNKSYLVKVSTKGKGGQKGPKFCLRGLYTAPNQILNVLIIYVQSVKAKSAERAECTSV